MRTYSLYLSTLTGANIGAVFTATIATSTSLTVSSTTSGTISANQYVVINGIVNFITNVSGNTVTLQNSTSTSTTASIYTSYTLQSNPPKYTPSTKNNLANVKWNINWREIFGNRIGECRVRTRFLSNSSALLNWYNNIGSIRISLASNTSNSTNGFNIACVRPQSDYTTSTTQTTYLDCDTTTSEGCTCIIPNSNSEFSITILDRTENLMSNCQDYQIWLYFDVDDENPLNVKENKVMSSIYNPR